MYSTRRLVILAVSVALGACGQLPAIKSDKFVRPTTVAIVEAPTMRNAAVIHSLISLEPEFHFSPLSDYFFLLDPSRNPAGAPISTGDAGIAAAASVSALAVTKTAPFNNGNTMAQIGVSSLVGALIDASAASTQQRAEGFHTEVAKRIPDMNLGRDFSDGLQAALKRKGIEVMLVTDSINTFPRLRWPTGDMGSGIKPLPISTDSLPAVNADILVQYSPVAFYKAPGPLNSYQVRVTVGVALYNGRTKEYLGHQIFSYTPKQKLVEYRTYSGLEENIGRAMPALRTGLLAMVPAIADAISKDSPAR